MRTLPVLDLVVLVGYLVGLTAYGYWFFRKQKSADEFMAAGRSLPGWAVGLSIFGSYVSSISFLANPGKAFSGNWNPFVFSLSLPVAAWIAVRWFVPFYRKLGDVSAYHHLEQRFGSWACTYAVVCYLLTQMARMGTILYLLALALQPLLGWDTWMVILLMGALMTVYPLFGGTEGVIWVGVVQAVTLVIGAVICLVFPFLGMPEGPGQVVRIAAEHGKLSLGSMGPSLSQPTFWVVLVYGLFINLQNFGIDQSYVQRYITARSDRDAARSVWMGALLYIPLSACFFAIGTALFAFYTARPELLPAGMKADAVLPLYISTQLPVGMAGVIVAAICAAALDSNLNCMATLTLCDIYKRYFRPEATERESMRVLQAATLGFGVLGTGTALAMIRVQSALDAWWNLAGIFSGGMLGLFLLGMMSRRARGPLREGAISASRGPGLETSTMGEVPAVSDPLLSPTRLDGADQHEKLVGYGRWEVPKAPVSASRAGIAGVSVGVAIILWMTLSPGWGGSLAAFRSPFHSFLTIVFGTTAIVLVGFLVGAMSRRREGLGETGANG